MLRGWVWEDLTIAQGKKVVNWNGVKAQDRQQGNLDTWELIVWTLEQIRISNSEEGSGWKLIK